MGKDQLPNKEITKELSVAWPAHPFYKLLPKNEHQANQNAFSAAVHIVILTR